MDEQGKHRLARAKKLGVMLSALMALTLAFVVVFPALNARQAPQSAAPTVSAVDRSASATDPIDQFRAQREQVRAVEVKQYNALIGDDKADQTLRDEARRQLLDLTAFMEQEVTLEGVLGARGFADALATVHRDSVNVLVRGASLTRAQSAVILELALRETGQQSGNIKIIPVA